MLECHIRVLKGLRKYLTKHTYLIFKPFFKTEIKEFSTWTRTTEKRKDILDLVSCGKKGPLLPPSLYYDPCLIRAVMLTPLLKTTPSWEAKTRTVHEREIQKVLFSRGHLFCGQTIDSNERVALVARLIRFKRRVFWNAEKHSYFSQFEPNIFTINYVCAQKRLQTNRSRRRNFSKLPIILAHFRLSSRAKKYQMYGSFLTRKTEEEGKNQQSHQPFRIYLSYFTNQTLIRKKCHQPICINMYVFVF